MKCLDLSAGVRVKERDLSGHIKGAPLCTPERKGYRYCVLSHSLETKVRTVDWSLMLEALSRTDVICKARVSLLSGNT